MEARQLWIGLLSMNDLKTLLPCLHCSDSDEVGKSYERDPNSDNKNGVGNEIREDHEDQPADQGDARLLLLSVNEEAKTD